MVGNDSLKIFLEARATIVANRGVSVSQPLVRVVLKTLGYSWTKVVVDTWPSCTDIARTAFLERWDRYEAGRRWIVFSLHETCYRRNRQSRYGVSEYKETFVRTTKRGKNEDTVRSNCSGFIWRPQFRSWIRLIQQHLFCRIIEDFSLTSGDVLLLDSAVFQDSPFV